MNPSDLKIGLLLPSWTGALDGVTPSAREVIEIAQLAEHVGCDTVWGERPFLLRALCLFPCSWG